MKSSLVGSLAAILLTASAGALGQAGAGAGASPGGTGSGGNADRGTGSVAPRTDHPGPAAASASGMSPRCDGLTGAERDHCVRGANASRGGRGDSEPQDTGVTTTTPPDRGVQHRAPGRRVP